MVAVNADVRALAGTRPPPTRHITAFWPGR